MRYPVAIDLATDAAFMQIVVPDIPGATARGATQEEAFINAVQAAHSALEKMALDGKVPPAPSPFYDLRQTNRYAGCAWGVVEIDITPYLWRSEQLDVGLPRFVLKKIDQYVARHKLKNRSVFLADAAIEKLGLPPVKE